MTENPEPSPAEILRDVIQNQRSLDSIASKHNIAIEEPGVLKYLSNAFISYLKSIKPYFNPGKDIETIFSPAENNGIGFYNIGKTKNSQGHNTRLGYLSVSWSNIEEKLTPVFIKYTEDKKKKKQPITLNWDFKEGRKDGYLEIPFP